MNNPDNKLNKLLQFADDPGLAMFDELQAVEDSLNEFNSTFSGVDLAKVEYIAGEKGDAGEPGRAGAQGPRGEKGDKGDAGREGYDGFDGVDGKDGAPGRDGINGKDGSPDTPYDIKSKLESLEGEERLDAFAIKNLPKLVGQVAKDGYPYGLPQPAGAITYKINGTQSGRGNILNFSGSGITGSSNGDTFTVDLSSLGGGVTQIIAGTNISISPIGGTGAVTINATGAGFSPYTIENGDSIFSTGLPGAWNSTATKSFISGVNAGDNADAVDSFIAIGELAGASDDAVPYLPHNSNFIGNRAGYNAHDAIDATFLGHLAGAYAEYASYSFFAGAQAGISATYAGNSFMFGQAAGHNATNAAYSTFIGLEAGYDGTNDGFSNFVGNLAGFQATNANNSTFIGSQSGRADTVNNAGTITYTGSSGTFNPVAVLTTPSGGRAYVISDNGAGTMTIMDSSGTFNNGETVTEFPSGITATVSTYVPSTSSILIGDHTSTGGGKNSVAIGARATNGGFNNSIVIGVDGANDANNQYAWGDSIINWKFGGNNYQLPFYLPSGTGQYLGADPGGILNWSVPGSSANSISVLAATTGVLPFTPSYANGAAGVGATLTAGSNGVLIVDGITIPLNGRVLVKDQASQLQNGVYQLSTVGTGGVAYVLTRTTDSDAPSEFNDQVVIPAQGTQSATPYGQQNVIVAIGTDPIAYSAQASLYVRQETSGVQLAGQIPFYTSTAKTISKGVSEFMYDIPTGTLILTGPNDNMIVGQGVNAGNVGGGNVFFGPRVGTSTTSGASNTGMGVQAGLNNVSGSNNVWIGVSSGNGDSTTNNSITIGANTSASNLDDVVALGLSATATRSGQLMLGSNITRMHLGLESYANDAAAGVAGLVAGDWYYNTTTPAVDIKQ